MLEYGVVVRRLREGEEGIRALDEEHFEAHIVAAHQPSPAPTRHAQIECVWRHQGRDVCTKERKRRVEAEWRLGLRDQDRTQPLTQAFWQVSRSRRSHHGGKRKADLRRKVLREARSKAE